jgi:hypothetical protein
VYGDTWVYDGSTFTSVPLAELLGTREVPLAYDARRGRVVLLGGVSKHCGAGCYGGDAYMRADTWEFDGIRWKPGADAPSSMLSRFGHAMAYDANRGRVIAFGGFVDTGSYTNETWELDGASWTPGAAAPASLEPRFYPAMAYDATRGSVVLFGGRSYDGTTGISTYHADTWLLAAGGWQQAFPIGSIPSGRYAHAMAFDRRRDRIVLVGGATVVGSSLVVLDDEWTYDGTTWQLVGPTPFGPRHLHGMTWDDAADRLVMFGGGDTPAGFRGDTWEHDGSTWLPGGAAPPDLAPRRTSLAFSAEVGGIVLFGGQEPWRSLGDTWRYTCLDLGPSTLPDAAVATGYLQSLTATGGAPPYTFTVSAGTLPRGLALSPSGVLAGIPDAAGGTTFLVHAQDASGCAGSRAYTIAVGPAIDILVGQGHGAPNANGVRLYRRDGTPTPVSFLAYGAGKWGANVAGGDIDGAPWGEILTGPGPGAVHGPQVRGFERDGAPIAKVSFYAYGTLRYGVNVAGGEIDGDLYDEVLTGAGPGSVFGPHVRGFDVDGGSVAPIPKASWFAYGTTQFGVNVTAGDLDGDGFEEVATAPGPGPWFAAQVRGFDVDGTAVSAIARINFIAFAATGHGGVVGAGDVDGDAFAELVAAPGPGPTLPSRFLGFDHDGGPVALLRWYDTTPYPTRYGGRLGFGDVDPDGREELLTGPGPDPSAPALADTVRWDDALERLPNGFLPFAGGYGVNLAAVAAGY